MSKVKDKEKKREDGWQREALSSPGASPDLKMRVKEKQERTQGGPKLRVGYSSAPKPPGLRSGVQAYLGGIPGNYSMIILDLYNEAQPQWERLSSYYGKQWVWCELHDYGGNIGIEGNFVNITAEPLRALSSPGSSKTAINRTPYVSSWVSRRYNIGNLPIAAVNAWRLLGSTVYSNQDQSSQATVKSILELAPAVTRLVNRTAQQPALVFYDMNTTIVPALHMLLEASQELKTLHSIPEFRYDLVDVTRQLLAKRLIDLYESLVATYSSPNSSALTVEAARKPLLQILYDLDQLLLTDSHFLLANWINAATSWSHGNATYSAHLEYTARNQITLWGPDREINDYASKKYGGLVAGYYAPR
ncbi:NAGLU-domain-containing protein [Paxillus ammoniavirescens]|nr:NAGLU-domain-containing protein [Paxillus ammoniavirescens]